MLLRADYLEQACSGELLSAMGRHIVRLHLDRVKDEVLVSDSMGRRR